VKTRLEGKNQASGLRPCAVLIFLVCWLGLTASLQAQNTTFTFYLDEPCKTSAGVFSTNGTLVRTLWSKVRYYAAGTNTAVWNGLDDNGNAVAAGAYQIKVLQHNTEYVWDGAIGNTSTALSGPTVHRGFWPMADMAITGTNAFYVSGYDEGMYDFRNFLTTNPQSVQNSFYWVYSAQFNRTNNNPGDIYDFNWLWVTADTNRVYFGCSATPNPTNVYVPNVYPGCIVCSYVSNCSSASFSNGVQIMNNGANSPLPNGIYVGTQPGLSGLSVQQNGNLLAVSVAPDNKVYLVDKNTGSPIISFNVTSPGRLCFSPDGSLWVISSNNVNQYLNPGISPALALTIPNFSEPLDVAVNPTNANLILVADGGTSQQVKAYSTIGTPLWTYGLLGGYQANGVAVATNKFWFFNGQNDGAFICFAPDGSFWVGDGGNNRALHFSAALSYIEQIMYQPLSYRTSADQNNPSRVLNQFMEFNVDYTKPLAQSWTLVNNWRINVDSNHLNGLQDGLYEVTTFTNGRTYALIDNLTYNPILSELCDLTTHYLRFTGILPAYNTNRGWISFGPDGSARRATIGTATWYEDTLNGFDTNNNPIWNPDVLLASASNGGTDPVPRCCSFGNIRTTISSNNILISFDQTLNNGWHLGGIALGGTNWLWKVSPAVAYMNGCGTYEISNAVIYAGNTLQAIDRNVTYGYHGEFFRSGGQACQNMHFYDDGLFVGQFGESNDGHYPYEGSLPGSAGNAYSPTFVKGTNGEYYLWLNDESAHGPQRWQFLNARTIRELGGTENLGGTITLTNPAVGFPTGVTGKFGNQQGELSWLPVPGASSYNLRYSTNNGGPYALGANTTNLDYVVGGLTNGQAYYFVVTAIQNGAEGIPSEQVPIYPFDITQTVLPTGTMTEGGQFTPVVDINPGTPSVAQPTYIGAEHLTGVLDPRELDYYGYGNMENETLGTEGYVIYDWAGNGTTLTNIADGTTVTNAGGWVDVNNLERQYRINNVLGTNDGLEAWPIGTINIGVRDTNYHFLTVISPAQFNNPRSFTITLTSTNNTSTTSSINDSPGLNHVFQYLFRGNVALSVNGSTGAYGNVQALFLDTAAVTYAPVNGLLGQVAVPATPTGLRVVEP
jgi:hypothetical protein